MTSKEIHRNGNHPISETYSANGSHLHADTVYWEAVARRDRTVLCNYTLFEQIPPDELQFRYLNQEMRVDLSHHCLRGYRMGRWQRKDDPLLSLVTVIYLKNIDAVYPLGHDIAGIADLKEGSFFTGPHALRTASLLSRFGNDPEGFHKAGASLDGQPLDMADAAVRLLPFPRLPLYYLLWAGDEEFQPRLQVLFDRSIEFYLPADAIWALVNRVTQSFEQA
jgi:hypothetical protein